MGLVGTLSHSTAEFKRLVSWWDEEARRAPESDRLRPTPSESGRGQGPLSGEGKT